MTHLTMIPARIRAFLRTETGAVTVDWIALTAALVLMGLGIAYFIGGGVPALADSIVAYMDSVDVVPD